MPTARKGFIIGSGLVILAVAAGVWFGRDGQDEQGSSGRHPNPDDVPCIGEDDVELGAAVDAQSFVVLLPSAGSIGEVKDVCQAGGGGIAIIYASGIELREVENDLADPPAAWKGIAARYPDVGYELVTVRGFPALAAAPSETSTGGLEWVEDGVKFSITGNSKATVDELQTIASSLSVAEPS